MKCCKFASILSLIALALTLIIYSHSLADAAQSKDDNEGSTIIKSNTVEVDNNNHIIMFIGNVDAKKGTLIINCQKLFLYYHADSDDKITEKQDMKINKLIATGNVRINRQEGGLATAEKAVFFQDEEKVVLTGNPVIKQGGNLVEGSTITLFLKENRSLVEGSKTSKAKAILTQ